MELVGTVARKRGDPARLAVEAAMTTAAVAVAPTGVRVPAVSRFDAAGGLIETERVEAFTSLMSLASAGDPRVEALCARVGHALAHFQSHLVVPPEHEKLLPPPFAGRPDERVPVHGDLNGSNVGFDPDSDRLVILDWSAAPSLGSAGTMGSPYFDPLWFALFFFRFRPFGAGMAWTPERWAGAFLDALAASDARFSAARLRDFHAEVRAWLADDLRAELARRARGIRWLPYRLWQRAGVRRWERFLETRR